MYQAVCKSTFHYGSIKMYYKAYKDYLIVKSTFHYGSIKIYKNKKDPFDEF